MIRVGFVMTGTTQAWHGGVNYLRNLVHAVQMVANPTVEPVLIVPPGTPAELLESFPPVTVLRTRLVDRRSRQVRTVVERFTGRDWLLERFLVSNGVRVLSHFEDLGRRSSFPTIGWLTDFQHRRMPDFFSPREIETRDRQFRRTISSSSLVLLSSFDAQRDLQQFAPDVVPRSRVLHFTSGFGAAPHPIPVETLESRYRFSGPYFHLPNQFWAHKNHSLVVDALALLKDRGTPALVLATGHTADYRHPAFFDGLMRRVADGGLSENFRVLGVVPYQDLAALMRHAVAVINPSRFEGWSTTVEESKSFGSKVLLSDIPVHREQSPDRALYFDPTDATALADLMAQALKDFSPAGEVAQRQRAVATLPDRFRQFGETYSRLVEETLDFPTHIHMPSPRADALSAGSERMRSRP